VLYKFWNLSALSAFTFILKHQTFAFKEKFWKLSNNLNCLRVLLIPSSDQNSSKLTSWKKVGVAIWQATGVFVWRIEADIWCMGSVRSFVFQWSDSHSFLL
jgi:hypothetical protein